MTATLVLALAAPAMAGEGYACIASAPECLDHMAAKMAKTGSMGIEGKYDEEAHVWTILSVEAESPAARAGFQVGDALYAFNGTMFSDMTEEDWNATAGVRVPGAEVSHDLKHEGVKKTLKVVLAEMPQEAIAKKVASNMLDHMTVASVP